MKIVTAIDSFKGSLSSLEVGRAFARGVKKVFPDAEIAVIPMADGGEGTARVITEGLNGEWVEISAEDPMHRPRTAGYGLLRDGKTAVMEMAEAAGLTLIEEEERNILKASTWGVGRMIRDAIERGCRNFIIGIGGSATNDCGIGMLQALGIRFYDKDGCEIGRYGEDCGKVEKICLEGQMSELKDCRFRVACDVTNPLLGEQGASYIYGPQKGGNPDQVKAMERMHRHFAAKTVEIRGRDYSGCPGAGAAGGLGFAFLAYLNAVLEPGVDLVMKAVSLESRIKDADYVITGEGCLDGQSAMGKVPAGVSRIAKKYGIPVIAVAGNVLPEAQKCHSGGMDAFFSILPAAMDLKKAMEPGVAESNVEWTAEEIMRLIKAAENRKNRR
ncbi:MAG: glycerate kinase [Ruminococcus sp.]|jgi:glycerate kinase